MTQPSYILRVVRDKQGPADLEFAHPTVTIGREAGDIALNDPGSSSRHAEIDFADGQVTLRDVGSRNGTWAGSRKVTTERMQPGVKYTIGKSTLTLVAVKGLEPLGTLVMPGPKGAAGTEVRPQTAVQPPPPPVRPSTPMSPAQKQKLAIGAGIVVLVLGLFFVFRGCGGDGSGGGSGGDGGSTRSLTKPSEVTVKAVWFKGPPGPQASGGTSPSTVRISPNSKEGASVGVLEEFAGGAGNQWRTATWLAAFSACKLTGQALTDYEFVVRTGGHIDGPSAGMLMTSTMIALLRGTTPRADTTMTGTINPDGSAGPVGGIVQKMEGASKDGIKRFGFPMGARNHQDLRNGRMVDLFDAGKEFGLEVREIRDVFEGYEFLTGDKLVRPTPVAESEMELDSDTTSRVRAKNQAWTARLRSEIANLGSVARGLGDLGKNIQPLAQQADAAFKKAQEFERSDFLASSYESYVQAAVLASMTKDAARFLKAKDDQADLIAQVEAAATVKGQLDALLNEVELQAKRKTGGGQINTVRAYQTLVIAEAFTSLGDGAVDIVNKLLEAQKKGELKAEEKQQLLEQLYQSIVYFSIAKTMLEVSRDQQDFGNEEGQSPPIPMAVIGKAAAAYGSAAGAVLAYLESLTIDGAAREAGVDKATAQNRLAQNDNDYLLAFRAVRIAEGITGKKNETNLLRLAAGSMAFLKGASLINKYYSLGGQRDKEGELTLTNRKALSAQLDLARQLAREAAAKAKKAVGFVPMAARYAYQIGIAKREGNDEEKLAALEACWESAFWSELAAGSTNTK
ncbi:MAG: FHA domain-containing protein [Planctomycetota bacterium]